jgi:hypothetical protein
MSLLEVDRPSDDIEDVMQAVGDAVRAWEGFDTSLPSAAEVDDAEDDLRRRAALLRHQWRVNGRAIIHSTRPRLGPLIIRFQTLVRRASWWFVEPVLLQIRLFQKNSGRLIDELAERQVTTAHHVRELDDLRQRVAALEERLAHLEVVSDPPSADLNDGA